MRLLSCQHPKIIRNKYTGELVSSRCGKCASCLNVRAKDWINRLDQEMQSNRFCYMVTLSYDNDHVPVLGFDEDLQSVSLMNRQDDLRIPFHELFDLCENEAEQELLFDRLVHPLGLPICYTPDISKFFKRFNKYCFKHVTFKFENFRYFCCHEYGPSTFRCHTHMLVFFNDRLIANRFQEILCACWRFGNSRFESVYSNGGRNYVAQYVNMFSHLPAFLTHSKIRPRIQFSKSPCIGSLPVLDKDIRFIYDRLPLYRSVWCDGSKEYINLPMPSSFNLRFFPKCPRYSQLSHHDRVTLYGSTDIIDTEGSFEGFYKNVKFLCYLRSRDSSGKFDKYRFITDYCKFVLSFKNEEDTLKNSLKRLYALSLRICYFAKRLNTSVDWLVSRIEEYWKLVDYEHLKQMYEFQEAFVKVSPVQELLHFYPLFYHNLVYNDFPRGYLFDGLSYGFYKPVFDSFGIRSVSDIKPLKDCQFYMAMKFFDDAIYKDTHKRHEINSYLHSHSFRRSDPKLQNILTKYFNRSKIYET